MRLYRVIVDDEADDQSCVVRATHALDAARRVADANHFGISLFEGATSLGRWSIATADEHRVQAWPAPPCPEEEHGECDAVRGKKCIYCGCDPADMKRAKVVS